MKMKNCALLKNDCDLSHDFENKNKINNFLISSEDKLINKLFDKYYSDQKTSKKEFLAEQIGQIGLIVTSSQIGIINPEQKVFEKIRPKIKIELIISEIFSEQGKIKIHVRAQQNKKIKNKLFTISGYKVL